MVSPLSNSVCQSNRLICYRRSLHREHWQLDLALPRNLPLRYACSPLYPSGSLIASVSGEFEDISLNQWLALVPHELVKAHLDLDDATIAKFSRVKQEVVGPAQAVA